VEFNFKDDIYPKIKNHYLFVIDAEIEEIYGSQRKFRADVFDPWKYRNMDEGYMAFHTYFD
jgi:hypothetical protein